jgi:hypothetical protein
MPASRRIELASGARRGLPGAPISTTLARLGHAPKLRKGLGARDRALQVWRCWRWTFACGADDMGKANIVTREGCHGPVAVAEFRAHGRQPP